jgi:hypothetical protein
MFKPWVEKTFIRKHMHKLIEFFKFQASIIDIWHYIEKGDQIVYRMYIHMKICVMNYVG